MRSQNATIIGTFENDVQPSTIVNDNRLAGLQSVRASEIVN